MTPTLVTPNSPVAPEKRAPVTFYSAAAGLIVNINNGRRIIEEGGTTRMVDQKIAEFVPIGDGFGRLVTADPEVIDKLTSRMGTTGDVFNGAEYTRRTTPADVQLKMRDAEYARLLEDHNRLLAKLQEEGRLPPGPANEPKPKPVATK
jgi:hypothetical protein